MNSTVGGGGERRRFGWNTLGFAKSYLTASGGVTWPTVYRSLLREGSG